MALNCKRIFLTVITFILCLGSAWAQSAQAKAEAAFKNGNYADAAQLYDAAASLETDASAKSEYYAAAKKSRNCAELLRAAESLYEKASESLLEEDYNAAKSKCQSLLKYNKNDKEAIRISGLCDEALAVITAAKVEEELWASVTSECTIDAYGEYLEKYPSGVYADEARNLMEQIELAAKYEAEQAAQREAELAAQREAELAAQREAELAAQREAELAAQREAELAAQHEAELAAQREAELAAKQKEMQEYHSFMASPTISAGRQFLRTYFNSEYHDEVSNTVAALYLESLDEKSPAYDFVLAKNYAIDPALKEQISLKESEIKRRKEETARASASQTQKYSAPAIAGTTTTGGAVAKTPKVKKNRVWLDVGLDWETSEKVQALSPRLGLKFGHPSDFFNFYAGVRMFSLGYKNFNGAPEYPALDYVTLPVYAGMKFGLFKAGKNGRLYLAVEGSYSLDPTMSYYATEDVEEYTDISLSANSNVWDLSGKLGLCLKWFDFGVYYKHLMKPLYNEGYFIDEAYDHELLSSCNYFGKFTSHSRLGVYVTIAIRLGKKVE